MTTIPPSQAQIKPFSEALATLLEDSSEGARSEAAICFGTLMKIVGERPLNAIMDQLAEVRKVKVKEAYEKAIVKCKAAGGAPKPPGKAPAAPAKSGPSSKSAATKAAAPEKMSSAAVDIIEDVTEPPKAKPPARFLVSSFFVPFSDSWLSTCTGEEAPGSS